MGVLLSQRQKDTMEPNTSIFGWNCHVYAIETAFKKEGFLRRTALEKPKVQRKVGWMF
jgi:hypothetical protein